MSTPEPPLKANVSTPPIARASRIPRLHNGTSTPSTASSDFSWTFISASGSAHGYDATLATDLRNKLHQIAPRPSSRIAALQKLAKDISRNFPTKEAASYRTCPPKTIRYSDLPSQMDFEEGIISHQDQDLFNGNKEGTKYRYIRKRVSKRSFRRDKVKLFLTKWRVGWTKDIPLPQMSPRIRLISAVDQGDYISITWAFKEWDVPDKEVREKTVSDAEKEGWDTLRIKESEREDLSEMGKDLSILEEVFKLLENGGSEMDLTVLQDIESIFEDMSKIVGEEKEESEADWENILPELEQKKPPASGSDDWDFAEENAFVSELLELDSSSSGGNGCSMTISDCAEILSDALLGDSICVNGTCLTITSLSDDLTSFKLGIAPETLRRTNLGQLKVNSRVNLERAMSTSAKLSQQTTISGIEPLTPNSRFGGHMVQGHVDSTAMITKKVPDGNAVSFTFKLPDEHRDLVRYIVEKGFITVDGASLTVTHVNDATAEFGVMLIAYTQEKVVTAVKEVGELVNIEVDQVGKYVEKSVLAFIGGENSENEWLTKFVERVVEKKMKLLQQQ
ncbi:hypothetical protein Dda_6562 [Drechslerella dactyloides]|uniref:Riboflavin synthase n=1 Tax=Drechslerella dactyloides TaxID=74499 RepID=A0AAD6NJ15_DREDA|nr:hypothetical protein Dda_6562 [Drechslerella dactyloides]